MGLVSATPLPTKGIRNRYPADRYWDS